MPEPLKALENQRGHRTKAERAARSAAESELRRKRVNLRAPDWMSDDAREIWERTKRQLKAFELLDNVDAEMLAIYCDACAHYQTITKLMRQVSEDGKPMATSDQVKEMQAWSRIVLAYAEKLGISPTARARLARRKAVAQEPDELDILEAQFIGAAHGGVR